MTVAFHLEGRQSLEKIAGFFYKKQDSYVSKSVINDHHVPKMRQYVYDPIFNPKFRRYFFVKMNGN